MVPCLIAWGTEFTLKLPLQRFWFLLLDHLHSCCFCSCRVNTGSTTVTNQINFLGLTWGFNTNVCINNQKQCDCFSQSLAWMFPSGIGAAIHNFDSCWPLSRWSQFLHVCSLLAVTVPQLHTGMCLCPHASFGRVWAGDSPALGMCWVCHLSCGRWKAEQSQADNGGWSPELITLTLAKVMQLKEHLF